MRHTFALLGALVLTATTATAQHSKVSSIAVDPNDPTLVWVANRGNASVSVVDVSTGQTTHEISVGVWPRSVAFSADGSTVFVANQRGDVDVTASFVTPFTGNEVRGSVSVIDAATKTVTQTITGVGTEPYGLAVAPNGKYFAVTGFRSGTLTLFGTSPPYPKLATVQFPASMNFVAPGQTVAADVDTNVDMIPDLDEPRAMAIRADSQRILVTHSVTGFVSAVDVTLDGSGSPTGASLSTRIDLNTYPFHPIFNPVNVQSVESQGTPRFLDDIALSPDGTIALVPHLLHNINHDVNHDFGSAIDGDFANRVYPALSAVDAGSLSFAQPGDLSKRLHHELDDPADPAAYVPYGGKGKDVGGAVFSLGGSGSPLLGGTLALQAAGHGPGDLAVVGFGVQQVNFPVPGLGTLLTLPNMGTFLMPGGTFTAPIPNNPVLNGASLFFQAILVDGTTIALKGLSNGVEVVLGDEGYGADRLGHRAGHPGRVLFNDAGDRAILLNRGSEDVFLYAVNGTAFELMSVFPPRHGFVERAPLDTSTPMGDLPLGMALYEDPSTANDDGILYVVNETTRTVSSLWIDFETGVVAKHADQIPTLLGPDDMTQSELVGQELFEDASRAQTAGNFNNSCASCHFEGGADGNIWQRPAGPRTTMPVYGGSLATGLILWKGVRLNLGETGPMFGGENGGNGIFDQTEMQGLIDYHKVIPVPLNPLLEENGGTYSSTAALGKDLFFGTDETGLNKNLRHAGCASCHPDQDELSGEVRGYTTDFVDPLLTDDPMGLETLDPTCFSLQENIVGGPNIRDVNSGVNVDVDGDGFPDPDRNSDGFIDIETYTPLNVDTDDPFTRDDPNGWLCPEGGIPGNPLKVFGRPQVKFVVPTKLGVFTTGPYMHDHSVASLRTLLDPGTQTTDPVFGNPAYPGVNKFFNEFHDIRGNDTHVSGASKVQVTLQTLADGSTFDADIEAILEYIASL